MRPDRPPGGRQGGGLAVRTIRKCHPSRRLPEVRSEIDAIAGLRRRSAFVREAVLAAVDRHRRTRLLREAAGILSDRELEWDDDPAAWVSRQRSVDPMRFG